MKDVHVVMYYDAELDQSRIHAAYEDLTDANNEVVNLVRDGMAAAVHTVYLFEKI